VVAVEEGVVQLLGIALNGVHALMELKQETAQKLSLLVL